TIGFLGWARAHRQEPTKLAAPMPAATPVLRNLRRLGLDCIGSDAWFMTPLLSGSGRQRRRPAWTGTTCRGTARGRGEPAAPPTRRAPPPARSRPHARRA